MGGLEGDALVGRGPTVCGHPAAPGTTFYRTFDTPEGPEELHFCCLACLRAYRLANPDPEPASLPPEPRRPDNGGALAF